MVPLYPLQRWGWAGSVGIWFAVVLLLQTGVLNNTPLRDYQGAIALAFLAFVVYSWVWPPILRRIVK